MTFDPGKHHRRSIRMKGYDYSQPGGYFVTVVARQRECILGEILDGEMLLSAFGQVADECWCAIPGHFPNVELGAHVIMPNHLHGIIAITVVGAQQCCAPTTITMSTHKTNVNPGSLGAIIRSFKSATSFRINQLYNFAPIWQRNYYDHIIRNADEANRIHLYIEANPANWPTDEENPQKIKQPTL